MKNMRRAKSNLRNRSLSAASRRKIKFKNTLKKIHNRRRAIFEQTMFEHCVNAA